MPHKSTRIDKVTMMRAEEIEMVLFKISVVDSDQLASPLNERLQKTFAETVIHTTPSSPETALLAASEIFNNSRTLYVIYEEEYTHNPSWSQIRREGTKRQPLPLGQFIWKTAVAKNWIRNRSGDLNVAGYGHSRRSTEILLEKHYNFVCGKLDVYESNELATLIRMAFDLIDKNDSEKVRVFRAVNVVWSKWTTLRNLANDREAVLERKIHHAMRESSKAESTDSTK